MTRRPIFIGVATVLALAMTAGLAFGAGRLVGTPDRSVHAVRYERTGTTGVVPGALRNGPGRSFQRYGVAFRNQMFGQMFGWMRDWMRNRSNDPHPWVHARYGGPGTRQSSAGYSGGTRHGYWDDHHQGFHRRGGRASGGYGSGGYHHGDWGHDCW